MTGHMLTSGITCYDVLNIDLHRITGKLSVPELKQAYHRALLLHHPDKLKSSENTTPTPKAVAKGNVYSVDEITVAYKTLSDPALRAEYDKHLRLVSHHDPAGDTNQAFHTGLETVDLDEMEYDDSLEVWFRSCRCGDQRGFQITEADLEKDSAEGEILTGCKGCSLWLRVLFAVSE